MAVGAIFDLDGTLVALRLDLRSARKEVIEELGRRGYDTSVLDSSVYTQLILDAAKSQTPKGGERRFEEARRAAFGILDRFEAVGVGAAELLPGVRDALDQLRRLGVRMAVLTNSGRNATSVKLENAGIGGYFEFVLTRDETVLMKPAPEGVAMAAARLGLPVDSTYYVGDSPYDIQAAKAAGVRAVALATGNHSVERLRSEGADYAVASAAELKSFFDGLDKQEHASAFRPMGQPDGLGDVRG
ncbi:MAG: HAD family hydrolase [Nitrososphaerota archaeon]|jgi:phosphoglycolate phosphatase|nr:HAD family hydrolase [Nitrososphaerota archaeon]MCL5672777.1 HAD family hydrolase [Nitrososphaerota archaeon]MDG6936957.1 HAD family hydrolase [Nitrososphaerota archaeon]MDG6945428.1 HAD family hydrolase [Nitrososphaerota archaeon]MDG6952104.1 HAD family hydrolase [Nitrososphaerota archaeon]